MSFMTFLDAYRHFYCYAIYKINLEISFQVDFINQLGKRFLSIKGYKECLNRLIDKYVSKRFRFQHCIAVKMMVNY